jgi:hypothetical protein
MATIKLHIALNNLADLLDRYDSVQVFRASTYAGTYAEITGPSTRPRIEPGKALYLYYDESGDADYWYKIRLLNSTTSAASEYSEATKGYEAETLAGIMTVEELKSVFLTGVDLTDDQGVSYPDVMFDFGIRAAISRVERELDLELRPTWHTDRYDFDPRQWQNWGFVALDHNPVIQVEHVKIHWPSASTPYEFPSEWIQCEPDGGIVNLVPTVGSLSQAMAVSGAYLPSLLASGLTVPRALEVKYQSGFAIGSLPYDIRALVGKIACFPILNTAGDLIAGAGIANFSISMDGLSQSVGTTSSATNSGYGARLVQFEKELKQDIPGLRRYYKGPGLRMA